MYSEKVRQLITDLPNRGTLPDATHVSKVENPVCGDITHLYLKLTDGVITESRFQTYGCPAAIAASAAVTLLCENKSPSECLRLDRESILEYLGGLPSHKIHGADLAVDALRTAIANPTG